MTIQTNTFGITINDNARQVLRGVVHGIQCQALREFLISVTNEPEIHLALLTPLVSEKDVIRFTNGRQLPQYPIHMLHRASQMAVRYGAHTLLEREVMYVGLFVMGLEDLISKYVMPGIDLADILFTLVRPSLHCLDDQAPNVATMLRNSLGWGIDDQAAHLDLKGLAKTVVESVRACHFKAGTVHQRCGCSTASRVFSCQSSSKSIRLEAQS